MLFRSVYIRSLLVVLTIFILQSCKKTTSPSPPPTSTTSTSGPSLYNGFFHSEIMASTIWSTQLNNSFCHFNISPSVSSVISPSATTSGGTVTLNSIQFQLGVSPGYVLYQDTTLTYFNGSLTWQCTGSGTVSAFSYTDNNPWPVFTGTASISDTVKLTQNNIIPLVGISNSDSLDVWVIDSTNNGYKKTIAGNATTVSFSPTELAFVKSCQKGFIWVLCYNFNPQTISGNNYLFEKVYRYQKHFVVIK